MRALRLLRRKPHCRKESYNGWSRAFSSQGAVTAESFEAKYAAGDDEDVLDLYLSNVFRLPGAPADAVGAFDYQVSNPALCRQWLGRSQLGQVVTWSEVLRQAASVGMAQATFLGMRQALQRSTALQEHEGAEAMEGLLRALMLSTPGTLQGISEVSRLVRRVLDEGLGDGLVRSLEEQGHSPEHAQALASWRGSDLLALPEWVLNGEGEEAVDRANLYWLPPTWPNPGLPAAGGVWHSSLLAGTTPWWAASTHTATAARVVQHLSAAGQEDALHAATAAAAVQYAADAASAMGQGWGASGSPEYLSVLVELAAGWTAFAEEYDSAWLVHPHGPPGSPDGTNSDLGVPLPASIAEVEGVAPQWAASRAAMAALLHSVPASSAAWDGLVKHGETVMTAAWQAVQSSADREESRDYFARLAQGATEEPVPAAVAASLPDYILRVLQFHTTYLPLFAQLRHQACTAAKEELGGTTTHHPILLALLQDTAKPPQKMGDVTNTLAAGRLPGRR